MNIFNSENQMEGTLVGLSPREAFIYLQSGAAIVDIRPEYEVNYRVFDASCVFLLSYGLYKEKYHSVPKEKSLIIVDSVGLKSPEVAQFFLDKGYSQVAYLVGGIVAWDHYGLPLAKDIGYELQGACACMLRPKKVD